MVIFDANDAENYLDYRLDDIVEGYVVDDLIRREAYWDKGP